MVLTNDFSGDEKSDVGTSQPTESQPQQRYIETDFVRPTIPASSFDDSESSIGTLTGTLCWNECMSWSTDDTCRGQATRFVQTYLNNDTASHTSYQITLL